MLAFGLGVGALHLDGCLLLCHHLGNALRFLLLGGGILQHHLEIFLELGNRLARLTELGEAVLESLDGRRGIAPLLLQEGRVQLDELQIGFRRVVDVALLLQLEVDGSLVDGLKRKGEESLNDVPFGITAEVEIAEELLPDAVQGLPRPTVEDVHDGTANKGGKSKGARSEVLADWAETKTDVKILSNIAQEVIPTIRLIGDHSTRLDAVGDAVDYFVHLVGGKQPVNVSRGQEGIDANQTALIEDLTIRHEEHNALLLQSSLPEHGLEVVLEVGHAIRTADDNLRHGIPADGGR